MELNGLPLRAFDKSCSGSCQNSPVRDKDPGVTDNDNSLFTFELLPGEEDDAFDFFLQEMSNPAVEKSDNLAAKAPCPELESGIETGVGTLQDKKTTTGNSNAERQRRYRQRTKQKKEKIKAEIDEMKSAADSARMQNKYLKDKRDAILSMLEYNEEAFGVLGADQCPYDTSITSNMKDCACVDEVGDISDVLQTTDASIGTLYYDVLSSFQEKSSHKDGRSLLATGMGMFYNDTSQVPPGFMYQLFRWQIGILLNEYDKCQGNIARQTQMEKEMKLLFGIRTAAISELAEKYPKIVLRHLTHGWVGGNFDEGIMPCNPERIQDTSLVELVKHLQLCDTQISCLCEHWDSFLNPWNHLTKTLHDILPQDSDIEELDSSTNAVSDEPAAPNVDAHQTQGLHALMHEASRMNALRQNLETISKEQVILVLKLAQNICSTLTPVQKARLCVFQAAAPNCIYLPVMLTTLPYKML